MIPVTRIHIKEPTRSHFPMSAKKLENLLQSGQNSQLDRLIQRAQDMDSLTTALRAGIEPDLAENLIAANVQDNGALAIICSSSTWASRLRFESERLVAIAASVGVSAQGCIVKVSR